MPMFPIGGERCCPRIRLDMNERCMESNSRFALSLSRTSVAVMLAFAAAHARADANTPARMDTSSSSGVRPDRAQASSDVKAASSGAVASTASTASTSTASAASAAPESVEFDPGFLRFAGAAVMDVSRFDKGNIALAGNYRAALYVNGVWLGMTAITLRNVGAPDHRAVPVFDRDLLARAGVDTMRLPDSALAQLDAANGTGGVALPDLIPQATATFDMGEQRLDVSVPQAMMSRNARGWVDPKLWDEGVPAATLQYNANVYRSNGGGVSNTQGYLGVTAGLNFDAWRFRYNGNVTTSSFGGTHAQSLQTNVQRSLIPLKSQLTLGDSYTDGSIFDSFGVRGVQLATDDRMYPESQRGYAPIVRGIANTNANVQVKQNGNLIYETTVAPGPFEINDLYPTGYGGDLQVIVTEADGSQHVASVPYAAPVNSLREGRWRLNVAAGQYRNSSESGHPYVVQAGVQHGVNNLVTLYGGSIVAEDYISAALGASLNTSVGAFAFDATQANANLPKSGSRSGQSLRLSFSRSFTPTNTDVTLAAYRYSTSGFLGFRDAMNLRDLESKGTAFMSNGIQKGRLQLTLNQNLDKWGSIYASGYTQNYWNKHGNDTAFQVGYNTNVGRVGVGVSASRELDTSTANWDNRVMLTLSVPLDLGTNIANSTTSFSHDSRDNTNQIQETFTGTLGKDYEMNYGVSAGHTSGDSGSHSDSLSANVGYFSPVAQLRANVGRANGYTQAGAGASGSVVAYGGGLVLSPQSGDTLAIVEANDAAGARIASSPGVRLNGAGRAAVAGMQPYSQNAVEIDTKGLPMGVQLKTTEQHFAPTAGAVSLVKFDTEDRGRAIVMRLRRLNGEPVPFGADVLDASGESVGAVTQGSRAMLYSKAASGDLIARWGSAADQSCKVHYALPEADGSRAASTAFADAACN